MIFFLTLLTFASSAFFVPIASIALTVNGNMILYLIPTLSSASTTHAELPQTPPNASAHMSGTPRRRKMPLKNIHGVKAQSELPLTRQVLQNVALSLVEEEEEECITRARTKWSHLSVLHFNKSYHTWEQAMTSTTTITLVSTTYTFR
ncbi:hypothetical protein D9758_008158 [Tetrapyrgos nigripes]|uniref:Uncharacterized protein n=1 Tax=Tetrapyrgos nigripes TaxID=182062 RepID=A0A8H5LPB6_9AGAR|nr:hypothetical protein D9758_008158 [Tetrapyrgos nigripes]